MSGINNGYGRRRKRQDSTGTSVEKEMAVTVYVQGPDFASKLNNSNSLGLLDTIWVNSDILLNNTNN